MDQDETHQDPLDPSKGSGELPKEVVAPAPAASAPPTGGPPATPPATAAGHIDIEKVLLPQKEVRKVQSEQRINAGALLEQEQTAGREGIPVDKGTLMPPEPVTPPVPLTKEEKPKEESPYVKSIETYQSDIEQLVQDKNVSVLTIAAAEADRRSKNASVATTGDTSNNPSLVEQLQNFGKIFTSKTAMILAGLVLVAAAVGGIAFVWVRPTSTAPVQQPLSPFIVVDDTKIIPVVPGDDRAAVMNKLVTARDNTNLSLGLIERLIPATASTTADLEEAAPMNAQTFLSVLAPDAPDDLLRNVEPTYLVGVHIYNSNQPFMILKIDSYEAGYAGMLAWEPDMLHDLSPLFAYTPRPRIPEENIGTTSASTTSDQFIQAGFVDKIVENHDARVLQNSLGDIYFLWTFLDRNTLVITTNEATLREVISRLQTAPVTPIPGQ